MRFFTTFTIIMIAVLFIFLDIAKRNCCIELKLIQYSIFIISGFTSSRSHNIYIDRWIFSIHSYCIYLENSSTTIARDYIWRISF